ncbi:MAG: DUF2110 family protein [Candidatus Bathyarchaeia archaeon]
MTTLTLLTKVYHASQLKQIDQALHSLLEGLDVEVKVATSQGSPWVQAEISGEDEEIAINLLNREVGFRPASLLAVQKFSTLKGYATNLEKSRTELLVDVGVNQPTPVSAVVPLSHLQAQLAGGKKTALKRLAELWGIAENFPLTIRVVGVDPEENRIDAELATAQLRRFETWRESLLDRLVVLGASAYQVKIAVEQAALERDVVSVEALGMFEHALVCKLGTDAAGLMPRLGRRLRVASFTICSPRSINAFLSS